MLFDVGFKLILQFRSSLYFEFFKTIYQLKLWIWKIGTLVLFSTRSCFHVGPVFSKVFSTPVFYADSMHLFFKALLRDTVVEHLRQLEFFFSCWSVILVLWPKRKSKYGIYNCLKMAVKTNYRIKRRFSNLRNQKGEKSWDFELEYIVQCI